MPRKLSPHARARAKPTGKKPKKSIEEPDDRAALGSEDKRDAAELYADAQEMLQPPISASKYRELVAIKKRAETALAPLEHQRTPTTADYVPYPALQDPDLNRVVAKKKEFALGAYAPVDPRAGVEQLWLDRCNPREFLLSPSQLVVKNFMAPGTPYNGLLLYHGVGVGKTCSAVTVAEQFPEKRVLVLVQPGLKSNFRENIFDFTRLRMTEAGLVDVRHAAEQCTGMRYLAGIPDAELGSRRDVEKRINAAIRARYRFQGTQLFAKEVERIVAEAPAGAAEERLRQRFSDHIIIVDEAHHLRVNLQDEERKAVTPAIRKVLKFAEGVKLLLLTATPMYNDVMDVVELLNLLLLNDKRRPLRKEELFDRRKELTQEGERAIATAARGYVSYLRGDDPFSFPLRLNPLNVNDPAALRPNDPTQPTLDIRGVPIPDDERMKMTVLLASAMSPYQRQVYSQLDGAMRAAAAAGVDDDSAGDGDAKADAPDAPDAPNAPDAPDAPDAPKRTSAEQLSGMSAFTHGMALGNIAYPAAASGSKEEAARLAHGRVGFERSFVQLPGRGLRVRYAVPPFLRGASLGVHAPKLKAVLERIQKSEGVVFVYSKFLPSGIIPLAIALEHAGFTRYAQNNILSEREAGPDRNAPALRHGWKYVALTGEKGELSLHNEEELAAARAPDNVDGRRVKVILGSNNASEGLDFRNVREVHVLDPWYHFNKIEQVVGRAARNCSHASLPPEKRNVTIYLHAARILGSPRESVDQRAYRIAELKQRRVLRVEAVLVANSMDCNLNKATQFYDPKHLGLHLDVVTSQGQVLRNFALGDRAPRLRVTCAPELPSSALGTDATTYDAPRHVGGVHSCKSVFLGMFSSGHSFTLAQVRAECRRVHPGVAEDAILLAVQETLDDRTPVQGPNERPGYVIYASDRYLFQPLDAVDERDGLDARRGPQADQQRRSANAVVFASPAGQSQKQRSSRSADDEDLTSESFSVLVEELLQRGAEERRAVGLGDTAFDAAALDAQVDRLERAVLLRLATGLLLTKQRAAGGKVGAEPAARLMASLARGAALWEERGTWYLFDYYRLDYLYFDAKEKRFIPTAGVQTSRAKASDPGERAAARIDYRAIRGYVLPPTRGGPGIKPRPVAVFKLVGESDESSGCVCSQTSSLKVSDVQKKIAEAWSKPSDTAPQAADKKTLCALYELVLRERRPDSFLRPAAAVRVFSQKGKRMSPLSARSP